MPSACGEIELTTRTAVDHHHDSQLEEKEGEQEEGLSSEKKPRDAHYRLKLTEVETKIEGWKGETQGCKHY